MTTTTRFWMFTFVFFISTSTATAAAQDDAEDCEGEDCDESTFDLGEAAAATEVGESDDGSYFDLDEAAAATETSGIPEECLPTDEDVCEQGSHTHWDGTECVCDANFRPAPGGFTEGEMPLECVFALTGEAACRYRGWHWTEEEECVHPTDAFAGVSGKVEELADSQGNLAACSYRASDRNVFFDFGLQSCQCLPGHVERADAPLFSCKLDPAISADECREAGYVWYADAACVSKLQAEVYDRQAADAKAAEDRQRLHRKDKKHGRAIAANKRGVDDNAGEIRRARRHMPAFSIGLGGRVHAGPDGDKESTVKDGYEYPALEYPGVNAYPTLEVGVRVGIGRDGRGLLMGTGFAGLHTGLTVGGGVSLLGPIGDRGVYFGPKIGAGYVGSRVFNHDNSFLDADVNVSRVSIQAEALIPMGVDWLEFSVETGVGIDAYRCWGRYDHASPAWTLGMTFRVKQPKPLPASKVD
jgi:hypothetical protein